MEWVGLKEILKDGLYKNSRVTHGKTYSKKMLSDLLGGFNEAKFDADSFMPKVEGSIKNAIALDVNPKTRWPNYLATRVYKLVQTIISSSN